MKKKWKTIAGMKISASSFKKIPQFWSFAVETGMEPPISANFSKERKTDIFWRLIWPQPFIWNPLSNTTPPTPCSFKIVYPPCPKFVLSFNLRYFSGIISYIIYAYMHLLFIFKVHIHTSKRCMIFVYALFILFSPLREE